MPAYFAYNAGIIGTQYTIRSIPAKVDQALRQRAEKTGKSLNDVVVEALTVATGVSDSPATFRDLDWFIGQKSLDPSFDQALDGLDAAPKEL